MKFLAGLKLQLLTESNSNKINNPQLFKEWDNTIHNLYWICHYPLDAIVGFVSTFKLDVHE